MDQETEQERPPNAGKCWLVLQRIKVHCVLVTALVITLLLTAGWLACAIGGVVRSDLGTPSLFALPFYYQLTATALAIPVAISATTTMILGMNGLAKLQQDEKSVTNQRASEMVYDTLGDKVLKGMSSTKLRTFSCGTVCLIFLGILLILLSAMIGFWSITLAYNIDVLIEKTPLRSIGVATVIAPVVCVEAMLGLIVPILVMLSVVMINSVLRFVTYDRVDIRKIMPKLLPFVRFTEGKKFNYWVAIGTFFFQIKDDFSQTHEKLHKRKWYHLCDTTKSTIVIFFILAFNFLLAWTAFVNGTLVHEFSPQSCRELSNIERERAVCLSLQNTSVVNCTAPESSSINTPLLCFQFLRFSEQSDILTSLTSAVVLYFIAGQFITIMLEMTRFLYLFHGSKLWAILVALVGVGVIAGDVVLIMASLVWNTARFDMVRVFQYLIIGIDIILVGVLLLISTPLELAPSNWKHEADQVFEESEEVATVDSNTENDKPLKQINESSENQGTMKENDSQLLEDVMKENGNQPLEDVIKENGSQPLEDVAEPQRESAVVVIEMKVDGSDVFQHEP